MTHRLVICSKSAWTPTIRREHALALAAVDAGWTVRFIERPADVRELRDPRAWTAWGRGLGARAPRVIADVEVSSRSTAVPGHRSSAARAVDCALLARCLRRLSAPGDVIVVTAPWQWPAVSGLRGVRRVFDAADDWRALMPARRRELDALQRRIGREADAVVAVSQDAVGAFGAAAVTVVPNGVASELIAPEWVEPPRAKRMAYAGTLSERFDAEFVDATLDLLPGWSLDLYGPAQYAGLAHRAGDELSWLLERRAGQVRWHGPVERRDLAAALDRADVLVVPHRHRLSAGQDLMKLYDYAARGRPIVTSVLPGRAAEVPRLRAATEARGFAREVARAADEPRDDALARRAWAAGQTWQRLAPLWLEAVGVPGAREPACAAARR
ncbi:MAG: hypothetical protein V7607_751 [Solirubrobacteraceae bacterium]